MSRKENEKRFREDEILDAAEKLIYERGFENTTILDIADKSEYSRTTVYKYFKNKEEIYLAVHLRGMKIRWEMIKQGMEAVSSPREKLLAFGEASFQFVKKFPHSLKIQLHWDVYGLNLENIRPELYQEFTDLNESARLRAKKLIGAIIENSSNKVGFNMDFAVTHFFHTLRTVLNQALFPVFPNRQYDAHDFFSQYLAMFIRGLEAL